MHILRPVGARIAKAVLQAFPGVGHHVFDLAAPGSAVAFTVDEVPPVAHLEHVRAFAHAVPDHVKAAHKGPVFQVVGNEVGEAQVTGNNHVPFAVVGLENLRIAEVVLGKAKVVALQGPEVILGPGLEVRGGGAQHHFTVGAVAIVAGVIQVVQLVGLVVNAAAGSDGGVLLPDGSAEGKDFAQGGVGGTVLGAHAPDGVEVIGGVVVELLQIQHFEFAGLGVIERHGVAYAADGGSVVSAEAFFVGRCKVLAGCFPVFGRVTIVFLGASQGGRKGHAG